MVALHPLSAGPAGSAPVSRLALDSTDYLACCAGPALAALSALHSMDYLFCCAGSFLAARKGTYQTTPFYLVVSCQLAWGRWGRRDQHCHYDHLL